MGRRIESKISRLAVLTAGLLLVGANAAFAAAPEPSVGAKAMVVSPHAVASRAGAEMFEAGGNAIDAAVAATFALGVAQPMSTGIGGGSFLLIRLADGRAIALDARETAPAAATHDLYLKEGLPPRASTLGGLAIGTPGMVAGLALAVEKYGTLPLDVILAPAIRAAEEGVLVGAYHARFIQYLRRPELVARFPETARIQFPEGAGAGTIKRQPELAETLRAIAEKGPRAFYEGEIAEAIVQASAAHGGILSLEDLASYRPRLREPVRGSYRGLELLTFPPPSSGGVTLLEVLNVLEGFDLASSGAGSSESIHKIAEAMKLAFADRAVHLGDPDFASIPTGQLIDKAYAKQLRARIGKRAGSVDGPGYAVDDQGTAHLSVVDAAGNAVAVTGTINGPFGSLVTVPGHGILLNNEMNDFVTDPKGSNMYGLEGRPDSANLVEPGKRPLSSMAPTIVLEDGKLRFVAGSNGGPRIITSVLLTLLHHFDWKMDVMEAVSFPRFHHQWRPDLVQLEGAHPADIQAGLEARGHQVKRVDEITTGVEAISIDPETGMIRGAADPRRDGLALGL
jgi:gamma-glutamyltranspeptidase/glutathione hydrolase